MTTGAAAEGSPPSPGTRERGSGWLRMSCSTSLLSCSVSLSSACCGRREAEPSSGSRGWKEVKGPDTEGTEVEEDKEGEGGGDGDLESMWWRISVMGGGW